MQEERFGGLKIEKGEEKCRKEKEKKKKKRKTEALSNQNVDCFLHHFSC